VCELFMYNLWHFVIYSLLFRGFPNKPKLKQIFIYSMNSILSAFILVTCCLSIKWKLSNVIQPSIYLIDTLEGWVTLIVYICMVIFKALGVDDKNAWNRISYLFIFQRIALSTLFASYLTSNIQTGTIVIAQIIVTVIYLTIYLLWTCLTTASNHWIESWIYYTGCMITITRSCLSTRLGRLTAVEIYKLWNQTHYFHVESYISISEYLFGIVGDLNFGDLYLLILIIEISLSYTFYTKYSAIDRNQLNEVNSPV